MDRIVGMLCQKTTGPGFHEGNLLPCPLASGHSGPCQRPDDPAPLEPYYSHVLAKAWGIVKPNEEAEYDTNNFYDRLRELVAERERCAKIAEAHAPDCEGNGCDFIADEIRSGK